MIVEQLVVLDPCLQPRPVSAACRPACPCSTRCDDEPVRFHRDLLSVEGDFTVAPTAARSSASKLSTASTGTEQRCQVTNHDLSGHRAVQIPDVQLRAPCL